jgi:hypothetical protein
MNLMSFGFTKDEASLIKRLKTPEKIQAYINTYIEYDPDKEDRTVLQVIRDKKAECYNCALFAFVCLSYHGYESTIIELLARRDEEHFLAVYTKDGNYGSVAQSKFLGLRSRFPMYKNLHDLAVSYMEFYIAFDGRYSLTSHSTWKNLSKYKHKYLYNSYVVNKIASDINKSKFSILINYNIPDFLASEERYWSEVRIIPNGTEIPKRYLYAKKNQRK